MKTTDASLPWLLAVPILAALLTFGLMLAYLSDGLQEDRPAPLSFPLSEFRFVLGSGGLEEGRLVVDEFENGYALLTSGPVGFSAESYHVLGHDWEQSYNERIPRFFWRTSSKPDQLREHDLWKQGVQLLDLADDPDWQGEIIEFGFLFPDDSAKAFELGPVMLQSDSLAVRLRNTWQGWTEFEYWTMRSVNFLWGGEAQQKLPLPVVLIIWLLLSLLLLWISNFMFREERSLRLLTVGTALFIAAWLLLDLRWLVNHFNQVRATLDLRSMHWSDEALIGGWDLELYRAMERLKHEVLGDEPSRVLIVGNENRIEFIALAKAKYYLAPHSTHVARQLGGAFHPHSVDYFLFFGRPEEFRNVPGWSAIYDESLEEIWRGQFGVLYRPVSR
jgi:hypothetical protein